MAPKGSEWDRCTKTQTIRPRTTAYWKRASMRHHHLPSPNQRACLKALDPSFTGTLMPLCSCNVKTKGTLHEASPKGKIRIEEDKKHRATYKGLSDSEQKLQFFTARQVACRLLGSRGYLCQNQDKTELVYRMEIVLAASTGLHVLKTRRTFSLAGDTFLVVYASQGIQLDFLRKNNTGKLLWQVYGKEAAQLCIYGIQEHEETMWNAFRMAGLVRFQKMH
eukprot:Gb_08764 [translate_table: standard]